MSFQHCVSCAVFAAMGRSVSAVLPEAGPETSVLTGVWLEAAVAVLSIIIVVTLATYSNERSSVRKRDKLGDAVSVGVADGPLPVARSKIESAHAAGSKAKTLAPKFSLEAANQPNGKTLLSEALATYVRKGDVHNAQRVIRQMEAKFGNVSFMDYKSVITACAKANEPETAHTWLHRLSEVGLAPNVVCFNAVINSFSKRGDMSQALALTEEMKQAGVEYDTVTYNTFIDGWTRAGDARSAQIWMEKMLAAGVKPSVVSFGSVMRVCAQEGLTDDLERWMKTAAEVGVELNVITFSGVINSFAKNDDLASASAWLVRMVDYGVTPAVHCFMCVLRALLNKGDIGAAMSIVDAIRASKVEFDSTTLSSLVIAATNNGFGQVAQQWVDEAAPAGIMLSMTAEKALRIAKMDRTACLGKTYVGIIKEFVPGKFGHIECDKLYNIFTHDVFLSCQENPDEFRKGQRVTFALEMDRRRGLPKAVDVKLFVQSQ